MIEIIIFIIVSVGIIWLSWPSLKSPRSHGFPRFFAFESILALVLLNLNYWFQNPFSWHQIFSWVCLLASLFLVIHGFYILREIGKPSGSFENTTQLVIVGAYRYIRHPLYSSLLFLGWGAFWKYPSWIAGILVVMATIALVLTAKFEEQENINYEWIYRYN